MFENISVILVTYNAVATIELTIKSVIKFKDFISEFIIIDGASNDGTLDIVKKYKNFISYWISEEDKGIYDAMNKGWEKADYKNHILFLGAGDRILTYPSNLRLEKEVVYFGNIVLGDNVSFKSKADLRLRIGNTLHHQALLIPKRIHPEAPFNIKYKVYADFDFNQRLLKSHVKFVELSRLKTYVMPDGFSQHHKTNEWYHIIKDNFGILYAFLGYLYHKYQLLRKKTPNL